MYDIVAKGREDADALRPRRLDRLRLGPHGPPTGRRRTPFSLSGAYWRGDRLSKSQLQRIYGISFFDKKALRRPQKQQEEAAAITAASAASSTLPPSAPGGPVPRSGRRAHGHHQRLTDAGGARRRVAAEIKRRRSYLQQAAVDEVGSLGIQVPGEHVPVKTATRASYRLGVKLMNCPSHHVCTSFGKHITATCRCARTRKTCCTANEAAAGALGGLTRGTPVRRKTMRNIYCREDQIGEEIPCASCALLDRVYKRGGPQVRQARTRPEAPGHGRSVGTAEGALRRRRSRT